jgi:hypothetical protein
MKVYIFDMDGVLLKANGYHRALQETVRLGGFSLGFEDIFLSQEQISQFEALGISSEWHSSALCMAVMQLKKEKRDFQTGELDLRNLFEAIAAQPMQEPALQRARQAVEVVAAKAGVSAKEALTLVNNCEKIELSQTKNWFQQLVLGSGIYTHTYGRAAQFETGSYLNLYDEPALSKEHAARLMNFGESPVQGAAIMTNRPSNTLLGSTGTPEAELGARLVGLEGMPLIGYGEISWLADEMGTAPGELNKPAWQHAMAAILVAYGWRLKDSLRQVGKPMAEWNRATLEDFQDGTIVVFEDTPGGIISVEKAVGLLGKLGIQVRIKKMGIAVDETKRRGLKAVGAEIYPSINEALADLDDF